MISQEEKDQSNYKRGFFLNTVIRGFLILLPLTIVFILISIVFNFIFDLVKPISSTLTSETDEPEWWMNLISVGIFIAFIFIIGLILKNRTAKVLFALFERKYLTKLPLYNLIHQTIYQFVGMKKLPFSEVVLIDPFNSGSLMTGFVTDQINDSLYTIFVPTAPNPTNGNIYHIPKNMITFLDVSVQDAMRTIMGMGTGTCTMLKDQNLTDPSFCSKESKSQLEKVDDPSSNQVIESS